MERLRTIVIRVEIETTDAAYKDEFELAEDESVSDLFERVRCVVDLRVPK